MDENLEKKRAELIQLLADMGIEGVIADQAYRSMDTEEKITALMDFLKENQQIRIKALTEKIAEISWMDKQDKMESLYQVPGLYEHQGRYALLYDERYLRLFSCEPCSWLSQAQMQALKDMNHLVGDLTAQFRELFIKMAGWRRHSVRPTDGDELADISADMIAFKIVYVFWNRMNSTDERYETGFAKRGDLGRYLRALKEKDEIIL